MKYNDNGVWKDLAIKTMDTLPIGTIIPFGGNVLPRGYTLCDGREVSRTSYKLLFDVIGTLYGEGDGVNTFNLPNMTGKTLVGIDKHDADLNTIGAEYGEKEHQLTVEELAEHDHYATSYYDDANYNHGTIPSDYGNYSIPHDGGSTIRHQRFSSTGENVPHNNMQPSVVVNYVIKYSASDFIPLPSGVEVTNNYSDSTTNVYTCDYVNNIRTGATVYSGTETPSTDIGENGDLYIQIS